MLKIISIILYIILTVLYLINLVILGFHSSTIILISIFSLKFDIQILLFLIGSILLLGVWPVLFCIKEINKYRFLLLLIILILQIVYFRFSYYIPTVDKILEMDSCMDFGYCWDYTRDRCEKKDKGYCVGSKKRCDEVEGIWNEKEKYCKLQF